MHSEVQMEVLSTTFYTHPPMIMGHLFEMDGSA